MKLETDRKVELSFPIEVIMDRLFHFFPKEIREAIQYDISEDQKHLVFKSHNATDKMVRLLEEVRDAKYEPPPTPYLLEAGIKVVEPTVSVRLLNALKSAGGVSTVKDLIYFLQHNRVHEISRHNNVGRKTVKELQDFVEKHLPHLKNW